MIASGPKNAEFRKPHQVIITGDGRIERGVIKRGVEITGAALFSVQTIKNAEEIQAFSEGRRISDWRRLYTDKLLPIIGDLGFFTAGDLSVNGGSSLATDDGRLFVVGANIGAGEVVIPAQVMIDGMRFEIMQRFGMQNGILNHYKYYAVRKTYG